MIANWTCLFVYLTLEETAVTNENQRVMQKNLAVIVLVLSLFWSTISKNNSSSSLPLVNHTTKQIIIIIIIIITTIMIIITVIIISRRPENTGLMSGGG